MVTVRPARFPEDNSEISSIDPTFTTERIYQVAQHGLSFALEEHRLESPLTKTLCSLAEELPDIQKMGHVVLAEIDGEVAGIVAANVSRWNGRAVLWHLYVKPEYRGAGVGRALLQSVESYARQAGAWCVWLEAQNVNYPAIRFYLSQGFELCGLDRFLYDPQGPGGSETALFFAKRITG